MAGSDIRSDSDSQAQDQFSVSQIIGLARTYVAPWTVAPQVPQSRNETNHHIRIEITI